MPSPMSPAPEDLAHFSSGRARRAFTGVLWSGVNALVPTISGLIVFLFVSRILGPAELGYVSLAVAVVGTFGAFSPAGFGDALVQRSALDTRHLDTTFWLCLWWGSALYLGTVLLAGPIAALMREPMLKSLLPVVGLRLILDHAAVVPSALLSRSMQFRSFALRTLIASVVSMIVCLAVLQAGYGMWALVASQLVGAVVVCVVSWMAVAWRPSRRMDRAALRDLSHFGGFASGSRLISTINVDQLLIGPLIGSTGLGLFSFARRIFQMVNDVLTGALSAVAYPLLSSMQNEPEKLREAYLATTFLSSVLAFPCFVGLALIAGDLIPLLFGPQWTGAVPVLQWFCAIGLLSCIGILQAALIRAKGRADWWMWYQLVQQVLTGAVIVLLARLGISAAIAGIAIKTWLVWPFVARFVGRLLDLDFRSYMAQFALPLAGCTAMAAAVSALDGTGLSGTALLGTKIAVGAAVYAAVLLLLGRQRLLELRAVIGAGRRRG